MLKVFYWSVCPHCKKAIKFLRDRGIPFVALDIERQPPKVVEKVIDVNGGEDWVAPTLEYKGKWCAGEAFDADTFEQRLKSLGVIS